MALYVLDAHPLAYSRDDVEHLRSLRREVEGTFSPRWQPIKKQGFLGSGEKEAWQCPCGKQPKLGAQYCSGCETDTYGFHKDEVSPEAALAHIDARLEALIDYFQETPAKSVDAGVSTLA